MAVRVVFERVRAALFVAASLGLALLPAAAGAAPETFPSKPITMIVPYAPGGGGDTYSRLIQPHLEKSLGVKIVIENLPGAGGIVGQTAAFNRPADGYTMLLWSSPSNELNAITNETGFKIEDWSGLGAAAPGQTIVAVPPGRPWNTLDDLVADVRKAPGKYSFGGIGPYGTGGIAFALLSQALDLKGRWVPFAGTSEITTAVLGGHVDVGLIGGSERKFVDLMQNGKMKILAVLSKAPAGPYAEARLPTVQARLGVAVVHEVQRGHVVRAQTPKDRLAILREAYRKAATSPEFIAAIEQRVGPYLFLDGEQFSGVLHNGTAELRSILPVLDQMAGK